MTPAGLATNYAPIFGTLLTQLCSLHGSYLSCPADRQAETLECENVLLKRMHALISEIENVVHVADLINSKAGSPIDGRSGEIKKMKAQLSRHLDVTKTDRSDHSRGASFVTPEIFGGLNDIYLILEAANYSRKLVTPSRK